MATTLREPGTRPAAPPTRSWWQRQRKYVIPFLVALVVVAVIAVVGVLMLGGKEDNASAPASPAVAPQSEGVASPAVVAVPAAAPVKAPVSVAPASAPVAPVAAAPSAPAASAPATASTLYGTHYTSPYALQLEAQKLHVVNVKGFSSVLRETTLPGAPPLITVEGTLRWRGGSLFELTTTPPPGPNTPEEDRVLYKITFWLDSGDEDQWNEFYPLHDQVVTIRGKPRIVLAGNPGGSVASVTLDNMEVVKQP